MAPLGSEVQRDDGLKVYSITETGVMRATQTCAVRRRGFLSTAASTQYSIDQNNEALCRPLLPLAASIRLLLRAHHICARNHTRFFLLRR